MRWNDTSRKEWNIPWFHLIPPPQVCHRTRVTHGDIADSDVQLKAAANFVESSSCMCQVYSWWNIQTYWHVIVKLWIGKARTIPDLSFVETTNISRKKVENMAKMMKEFEGEVIYKVSRHFRLFSFKWNFRQLRKQKNKIFVVIHKFLNFPAINLPFLNALTSTLSFKSWKLRHDRKVSVIVLVSVNFYSF